MARSAGSTSFQLLSTIKTMHSAIPILNKVGVLQLCLQQVSGQTDHPPDIISETVCGGKHKTCAGLLGNHQNPIFKNPETILYTLTSWRTNWVKSLRWYSTISHQLGPTSFQLNCYIWCPPTSSTRTARSTTLSRPFTGSTRFQFLALQMLPQLQSPWAASNNWVANAFTGWLAVLIIPNSELPMNRQTDFSF